MAKRNYWLDREAQNIWDKWRNTTKCPYRYRNMEYEDAPTKIKNNIKKRILVQDQSQQDPQTLKARFDKIKRKDDRQSHKDNKAGRARLQKLK